MPTNPHSFRIGLFVAVAAALVVVVLVTFAGARLLASHDRYAIVFPDTVYGLDEGSNVYFNGVRVGQVVSLGVPPDDLRHVRVEIDIEHGTQIRTDTVASMSMAGITGLKVIDLRGGSATTPRLPPGSEIPSRPTALDRLQQQAEQLANQTGELMDRADRIAKNLEAASADLGAMISENRASLRHSLAAVDDLTRHLAALFHGQIDKLVGNATTVVGDLGRVVRTNEEQLRAVFADLRQASRSFKDFARDLRNKPSGLIFSKPARDRKLP